MKFRMWVKENRKPILIAGFFGLLPLLFCTVYCALYQKGLGDIYLPTSYWNDELFYYKQIEGILDHGVPGGYFGYNESRGRFLSFGAWSPVFLYVWVLWGLIFGWGMLSPIICNLVVISICMIGFAWMARPNCRQAITAAILMALFSPLTRYMMSMSLEVLCFSLTLLYVGALFGYEREKKNRYLWIMMAVSGLMTLNRPYLALLVLYPAFLYGKQGVKKAIAAVGTFLAAILGYFVIKYLFSADYVRDLFDVTFLTKFFEEGIVAGFQNLWLLGKEAAILLFDLIKKAIKYGHSSGAMYAAYGLLGLLFIIAIAMEWKKRKSTPIAYRLLGILFLLVAMMMAILCMRKIHEGARYLMVFVLIGVLFLGMYEAKKGIVLQLVFAVALSFFFVVKAGTPYDYLVPFDDGVVSKEVSAMNESLEEKMDLQPGITWDNTVIWLASDMVDGESVVEEWQQLYAIPGGFGINHCSYYYVYNNLDTVKSRYIAAVPGGDVEKLLIEEGALLLEANDKIAVYDRRPDETN